MRHTTIKGRYLDVMSYVGRTALWLTARGVPLASIRIVSGPNDAPVCTWSATMWWAE